MADVLASMIREYRRHKDLADRALAQLDDTAFFHRPAEQVNPVGLIVKHLAGNLTSRWTDFLTSDGEKPNRDRDSEFLVTGQDTRSSLLAAWEKGWRILFATLETLRESDLERTVLIRGEPHTVLQAVLRGLTHAAYHIGQMLWIARLLKADAAWLTIPPGGSQGHAGNYLSTGPKPV